MRRAFVPSSVLLLVACAAAPPPAPDTHATSAPPAPATAPVPAPPPSLEETARALQASALGSKNAEAIVRSLTSEVGARIAGGPKEQAAIDWARRTLASNGLANVRTEPVKVPHWVRGVESVEIVGAGARKLSALALGGSLGTPDAGIVADVIEVGSIDALDKLDEKSVRGKIVFFNSPMKRTKDGSGYGEAVGVRFQGPTRAGERGAVAAIIRSIGTDSAAPHTGATSRKAKIPAAALSGESADALHELLLAKKRARVKVALGAKWHDEADGANVIGEIAGERADEIVLLGAHLDSWDVGQGAVDDGAGCAIVIEAAKTVAALGRTPRRTVRVVLFAAEELGLSGGAGYAEAHAADAARHVVAMEADSGTAKVYGARFLGGPERRPAFEAFATLLAPLGVAAATRDGSGGADLHALKKLGVPVIDLDQDFSGYFDVHHTENDTFAQIDPQGLAQAAAAFATMAWAAANAESDLGRVPDEKRTDKW